MDHLRGLFRKANDVPGGRTYTLADGSTHTTRFATEDLPTNTASRLSVNDSLHDTGLFRQHGYDQPWTRDELIDKIHTDPGSLSAADRAILLEIRDRIGAPEPGSVMQKALDPQAVRRYLENIRERGRPAPDQIRGYVTHAPDTAHIDTPSGVYDSLRLDYPGSGFRASDNTVSVVRYSSENAGYDVPRSPAMGGTVTSELPFTGNGFTGARDDVVPEFQVVRNTVDRRGWRMGQRCGSSPSQAPAGWWAP